MRWTHAVSWLALACASASAGRGQTTPAAVRVLVDRALANNREIAAVRERVAEARGLLRQAGVRLAPTVEASGATGRPLNTQGEEQYTVGYALPIETGGKRARRVEVAELGVALAEAELAERTRQLAFEVATRYAEAVAEQRRIAVLDRLLAANREVYRVIETRVAQSDVAPLDAQLLLADLRRAEAQRATAAGRQAAALAELRRVIGLSAGDPLTFPPDDAVGSPAGPTLADLQGWALAQRSDLRIARLAAEQAAAEVALAEAQARPDVTLSANYARTYGQFDNQFGVTAAGTRVPLRDQDDVVTFGVSVPLTGRRRNLGNIEAAAARQRAARQRQGFLETSIPLEVEAAYRRLVAARESLTALESSVALSEKNLEILRQAYQLGQQRITDVLAEARRLLEAQLAVADTRAELLRAESELVRATGELP